MPVGGLRASDPHFLDLADPAPRNAHLGRGLPLGRAQGEEDLRAPATVHLRDLRFGAACRA
jgi:hypothetical protein